MYASLSRSWWKDLGLAKELKLARDQPLKWHMWPIAMLTDPSLSEERIELTKPISLIYIIDDIFDVNGTIDELTLFTEAVNRYALTEECVENLVIMSSNEFGDNEFNNTYIQMGYCCH